MKLKVLLMVVLLLPAMNTHARKEGQARLDSLMKELPRPMNDTLRVKLYLSLCAYWQLADASKGLEWGMKALDLSKKAGWEKGKIVSCSQIGATYGYLGKFAESVLMNEEALRMAKAAGNERLMRMTYNNLGASYFNLANYPKALECYFSTLRLAEKGDIKSVAAISLGNIALVYQNLHRYNEALRYFEKSQDIFKALHEDYYVGIGLSNIGGTYQALKNYNRALATYQEALDLATRMGNKYLIAQNYTHFGNVFQEMGKLVKSLEYFKKALKVREEIQDQAGIAENLLDIGINYRRGATDSLQDLAQKKTVYLLKDAAMMKTAADYVERALAMARGLKNLEVQKEALKELSGIYEIQGNFGGALDAYRRGRVLEDSVFSMEKQKQIAGLEAKRENELKQKEIELLSEKNRRQKVLLYSTLGGLLMLVAIVAVVVVLFRNKRRAHALLLEKDAVIQSDLDKAKAYILSLLPVTAKNDLITTDWKFIPSSELGGDAFGYHWIDPDHFAFYILDVCGHGVGPALHAVSVMNILNSRSHMTLDLKDPAGVVAGLNENFQQEEHNGLFFSIWYGVYSRAESALTYVCAGHPAPVMVEKGEVVRELGPQNLAVGWVPGFQYKSSTVKVGADSSLILFSDGVYEFDTTDGQTIMLENFYEFLKQNPDEDMEAILGRLKGHFHASAFPDDYSMVKISFGPN